MESKILREKGNVNLYLDRATRDTFDRESRSVGLSFSAYLRVVGRIIKAWGESEPTRPISDLRDEIRRIVDGESRRV